MENQKIRDTYFKLERNVLILIAIPLPFFGFAYLLTNSNTVDLDLPGLPKFLDSFGLGLMIAVLFFHYVDFHAAVKRILKGEFTLEQKVDLYAKATMKRFWALFFSALLGAAGLLFFQNPGFTIALAVNLVFFSLGKPSPDRIVRLLKLKGEEKTEVEGLKFRG